MKGLTWVVFVFALGQSAVAQYYYKDIVSTKQNMEKWKVFKEMKVKTVTLTSFDANGQPTEGFEGNQQVAADFSTITTNTHSNMTVPSELIAYYDSKGFLIKTLDTSDTYQSVTEYGYDQAGRIVSVTNNSLETDNQVKDSEKHLWQYLSSGIPEGMLKIKNNIDTTFVEFLADQNGNVIEERAKHNNLSLPVIYYYYNDSHQMTDVVRYSEKAQRMLPDYIYEYDEKGVLTSMIFVPEGTTDYQKWIYQYDPNRLEQEEDCFNKKKELLGKIQYQYSFYH
jgi:YD repeat-containing protein